MASYMSSVPMSWDEARDCLRKFRDEQSRRSSEIVEIWESVLSDARHKLGDDLWPIYEQVCIAACDCGRQDIYVECLEYLQVKFPESMRVEILRGMCFEAAGKYDEAKEIYEEIRKKDEHNTVALKRQVAIYRSINDNKTAITLLNKYLKDYMADYESWKELCDLYLTELDYDKAAFCMEECIMSNPNNHAYYQKYAEIKYTQGGEDNLELARKNYAQALKIHPNNMRALYGFFLCASNLAATSKQNKKVNIRYAEWAAKEIANRYEQKGAVICGEEEESQDQQVDLVQNMLGSLQLYSLT